MFELRWIDYQAAAALKAAVALAATILLLWWWRAPEPRPRSIARVQDGALAALGVLAFVAWWNFGALHYRAGAIHHYEFFHYYIGAKYSPELGYTGLYDCVAAAEIESGRAPQVAIRWIRDLKTNELRRGSPALNDPQFCRRHFPSVERWDEFRHDVEWFRARMTPEKWLEAQMDHGYNASPVWTMIARPLADTGPASDRTIAALWWLDPALLIATWAIVWWAFGWRVLCVALIWWGTNYAARYAYIGGAFLRHDWLFLALGSICLAKRGRMAAAGFALAASALMRIFPALIALGLALKIAADAFRRRRLTLDAGQRRFIYGAVAALAVCVPLSLSVRVEGRGPFSAWQEFAANTARVASASATNRIGLPVVLAFDPDNRSERIAGAWVKWPWDLWREGRRHTLSERRPLQIVIVTAFIFLLAAAVRARENWTALTLGVGAIPLVVEVSGYYYGILAAFAFLWPRYPVTGVGLTATALLSNVVLGAWSADDDRYTAISAAIVILVPVVLASVAFRRQTTAEDSPPASSTIT